MRIRHLLENLSFIPRPEARPNRRSPGRPSGLRLEVLDDRILPSFSPASSYPTGLNPQAVVTADFNGDGRPDLALANYGSDTVSVLLGNAGGTFQPAQSSATGAGPLSLAFGDFNGDGNLDLATANAAGLSMLLGKGDGTFHAPNNLDIGTDPASVVVGDFNGDGKADLGVTSNFLVYDGCDEYGCYFHIEGLASVLLGTGTGSFSAPSTTALGYGAHTAAVAADFNGDLKLDFAAINVDYSAMRVLLGTGTGGLGSPAAFGTGYYPNAVVAGDVSGDGKLDLVTANYSGTVSVLLGTGAGTFGAVLNYVAGSQPRSVALADFNGDGKIDVVTANADTGTVSVLLGSGAGAFRPPVNAVTGAGPVGVAVSDFNGDGHPDAAVANAGSNSTFVLLNDANWPALGAPSIMLGNAPAVTEGNTGTVSASFTVTLSGASAQTVTVHYATADGSAVVGEDYQFTTGTLTFAPGQISRTILVPVKGDRLAEHGESFYVRLSDPANAFVADAAGVGTINDDEPYVSIIESVNGAEGNTGTTPFTFTVTLSTVYDAPVTVGYATADLTPEDEYWYGPGAKGGVDYAAVSGTITFAIGETTKTITVPVAGDRNLESDELFFVNLTNSSSAHLNNSQSLGIIVDDEPSASIQYASAVEANSGTTPMTFTISLSAAGVDYVTVTYATVDGSATVAGGDYVATTGSVTLAPGETSKTMNVPVKGDRLGEGDENFYVNLTAATGAHVGNGWASGAILDNEPRLSINSVSMAEGKLGLQAMVFTVTLSAAYDQPVTVRFATQNNSASAGSDYTATSGTLTFAPGQTTKTITVLIKGDKKKEVDEYFYVLLSGASSNSFLENPYGWGIIRNDD